MIVCSCNVVSSREIEAAVEELVAADPDVVLTPGMIYRALGVRPKCGTCLSHVVEFMHAHRESIQPESAPKSHADILPDNQTKDYQPKAVRRRVDKESETV